MKYEWTVRYVEYLMPDKTRKREEEFSPEELAAMQERIEERAMRAAGYEKVRKGESTVS